MHRAVIISNNSHFKRPLTHFISLDGANGTDAISLICEYPQSTLPSFTSPSAIINTLVYENQQLQEEPYSNDIASSSSSLPTHPYHVISLVLKNFNSPTLSSLLPSFSPSSLKYLSTYNSQLDGQFWSAAAVRFASIEAIHLEDSLLPVLGSAFSNGLWPRLNRLTIKSCSLRYIDLPAFSIGKERLRMLELADNELTSLLWLTHPGVRLSNLWLLDVQSNRLSHLPARLKEHLPSVRTLRLGGNRFLYFDYAALRPWFGVDEVSLYGLSLPNDGNSKLAYTAEIEWLKGFNASEVKANFLVSSFAEGFAYDCRDSPFLVDWPTFQSQCNEKYEVLPGTNSFDKQTKSNFFFLISTADHLYFNSEHRLTVNRGNQSETVAITGVDVNHLSDTSLDFSKLYTLQSHLSHLSSSENAIRIRLFSGRMLKGLTEKTFRLDDPAGSWKADLLIERVTAFLEEAEAAGKYVLLVLWAYEDVLENVNDLLLIDWQSLEEQLLAPLFTRLRHQRALIGVEVISNFLSGEFIANSKTFLLDEDTCRLDTELQHFIAPKMDFLLLNVLSVSRLLGPGGKAIGVSIPASCYLCLPLVTLPSCLNALDVKWLDFVSIISHLEEVESEVYSYINWASNVHAASLPPIFYVLKEGEKAKAKAKKDQINVRKLFAVVSVQQYASGYFTEYTISGSSWDWFPGKVSREKVSIPNWFQFPWK